MSQKAMKALFTERIGNRTAEVSYRRGVSQALALAADLAQKGYTWQDLAWVADESLKMREDHKSHPAYLDELVARFRVEKRAQQSRGDVAQGKVERR